MIELALSVLAFLFLACVVIVVVGLFFWAIGSVDNGRASRRVKKQRAREVYNEVARTTKSYRKARAAYKEILGS